MSHRHSCDRCRQQKVRCVRDESQGASSGTTSLARCERCTKAAVDCVYSLRQSYNRPSVQSSGQRDINDDPNNPSSSSWFAQGLGGVFCPLGQGSGPDFTNMTGPFPGVDDGRDATLQLVSPSSQLNLSTSPSAADAENRDVRVISTSPSTVDALSSQLMALSQRATQATRRLVRPGGVPPTVSSPEVSETFEDANTLIRIINNITADSSDDYGLVFLALASHQHLLALFRSICDVIRQCLESMASDNEHQEQQRVLHHSDAGPSSVVQFGMVLQLLLHLIDRMDRSLQVNKPVDCGSELSNGNQITLNATPPLVEAGVKNRTVGGSLPRGSLPMVAQSIAMSIPDEHEKLKQVIRELQTKIEHSEFQ
ncbi:hypothetical protein BKA56DRAFT_596835 [Ilyonectria sp. MPI-CAGE-AT-0026]|nr:hypothetical protein BKA56DRAFT_596835 [Ilyonectria sp. MPI-CAGE-AT-0026]